MGLLGKTAVVIYSSYPAEYLEEHSRFHSYEHLLERVSTAGFLRGRRCNAVDDKSPSTFAMYEVADPTVVVGGEYIDKLNNPTDWTLKFRPLQTYASRTLCQVVKTVGLGTGARMMTVRFTPATGREDGLKQWVCETLMPQLEPSDTLVAAHFLTRDLTIERPMTEEERICAQGAGSKEADWILLVEGWDEYALRALSASKISASALVENGATREVTYDFFALSHVLSKNEMKQVSAK